MNDFEYEKSLAAVLQDVAIPGLLVRTTANITEDQLRAGELPTAIVALGDEVGSKSNDYAVLAEVQVLVYLVLRGAITERTEEDTFFREEIFQALHGVRLQGLNGGLEWRSTESSYEDDARTYRMTFAASLTKHKRSAGAR